MALKTHKTCESRAFCGLRKIKKIGYLEHLDSLCGRLPGWFVKPLGESSSSKNFALLYFLGCPTWRFSITSVISMGVVYGCIFTYSCIFLLLIAEIGKGIYTYKTPRGQFNTIWSIGSQGGLDVRHFALHSVSVASQISIKIWSSQTCYVDIPELIENNFCGGLWKVLKNYLGSIIKNLPTPELYLCAICVSIAAK